MAKYLIDYDLNSPGQNYDKLIEKIKTYSWAKICMSSWAISTSLSAVQIRDSLIPYLDSEDRLLVVAFDNWASWGLPEKVNEWLKAH